MKYWRKIGIMSRTLKVHINRYPAMITTYRIMWCGKKEENMQDARVTNQVSRGTCIPCRDRYFRWELNGKRIRVQYISSYTTFRER